MKGRWKGCAGWDEGKVKNDPDVVRRNTEEDPDVMKRKAERV
jgi:hypothetical protein